MNEKRMADLEKEIERCENSIRSVYDRLDACEKENAALRELIAARPMPIQRGEPRHFIRS